MDKVSWLNSGVFESDSLLNGNCQ